MSKSDKLLGTLDLLVLRTLAAGEAIHGRAIADHVHDRSRDALRVEEGSLYPALDRMEIEAAVAAPERFGSIERAKIGMRAARLAPRAASGLALAATVGMLLDWRSTGERRCARSASSVRTAPAQTSRSSAC